MNPQTISRVQASWSLVQPIAPQAAALFYGRLFTLDPSLQSLFKGDMQAQGKKLMTMIGAAVAKLDDVPTLLPVLRQLGQRHAGYAVRPSHYATVGEALLGTLAQGLGSAFTPAVEAAWTEVYGVISRTMIESAETLPAAARATVTAGSTT